MNVGKPQVEKVGGWLNKRLNMKRVVILGSLGVSLCLSPALFGFKAPDHPQLPNFDKRVVGVPHTVDLGPDQALAAARLRNSLPGVRIDVDRVLGAPKFVGSTVDFLSGPGGVGKGISPETLQAIPANDPHRIVKAFLNEQAALFGHGAEVIDAARVKKDYVTPHNGLRTVVWQQQVDGIGVFDAVMISHVTKNGELVNIASQFLPTVIQAANAGTPNRAALQAAPAISAAQAVVEAANNLGEPVALNQVVALDPQPDGLEKLQNFSATPVLNGETKVHLTWLPLGRSSMRLCWQVLLTGRTRGEMFHVIVDAENGQVLVRRCLTAYLSNASYRVYTSDSPSPFSPSLPTPSPTQPAVVQRVLVVTNAFNTNASPNGWINDADNETRGNNVDAHLDRNRDDQPDLPRPQGNPNRVFDIALDLTQAPTTYGNAAVVQLFYLCNWYHDKLYELGFTEQAGNFQVSNFNRGGAGNDSVQADAQDGSGVNNANFATPPDGTSGRMQMYVFDGPNPDRDGDLDAEIVFHEHTHGLSNRLVGGGVGISEEQSSGMGEGWSDWYGLALLSEPADNVNANYAVGGYATYQFYGLAENYYFGIRRYPYSTDLSKNPLTFKDIDPSQASSHSAVPLSSIYSPFDPSSANEVHFQGEVWCVTLWEARANLVTKWGYAVGNQLILQLVTDGMKLAPMDPNFLQARDAIIQADLVNTGGANFNELWMAFAKRGMGGSASSPSSSTTVGVVEAYDLPGLAVKSVDASDTNTGNGNGSIDFNECNEVNIVLINNSRLTASNITATLSTTTPGVTVSQPDSAYPNIPNGATGTNLSAFRIYTAPNFACGVPIDMVLLVQSGTEMRTNKFRLSTGLIGPATAYDNSIPVSIPDGSPAGVDSPITVFGFPSAVAKATVSLYLTHSFDFDLTIQLISPDGTRVTLAANKGGIGNNYGASCSPLDSRTTFDDKAAVPISSGSAPFVGTFRPDQPLSAFAGKTGSGVNGTWRLHIVDSFRPDVGILQCWSLNLSSTLCSDGGGDCSTDVAISSTYSPNTVIINSNLTYTITVTNLGPNTARSVGVTDVLPAGATFVSATPSKGSCSQAGGIVSCGLGTIAVNSSATVNIVVRPTNTGFITNVATVASSVSDNFPANNTSTLVLLVRPPSPIMVAAGSRLILESGPVTGGIEVGETVTINFLLQNIGSLNTANLVATLLSTGGVNAPSAPKSYGVVLAGGALVGNQFTFTASGVVGGNLTATFQLQDGTNNLGNVAFTYGLGGENTFTNQTVINIPNSGAASPYPSSIPIAGLSGLINKVTVSLVNVTHTSPDDIDVLLVGPNGRNVLLMSDAGGFYSLNNVTLGFDDFSASFLPDEDPITAGIYKPTDYAAPLETNGDVFPPSAPAGSYGSSLAVFNGAEPNGLWSIFVLDDTAGDVGRIGGGWRLTITTFDPVNPAADLAVSGTDSPDPVLVGSNITYTIIVTNSGPDTATGVVMTNRLPVNATYITNLASQGSCSNVSGRVLCDFGTITNHGFATVTIVVTTTKSGTFTNIASIVSNELDLNLINSTATILTTVSPVADLAVSIDNAPNPGVTGNNLTYTIMVTNKGPNSASGVYLTNVLPAGATFSSAATTQGTWALNGNRVVFTLGTMTNRARVTATVIVVPSIVGTLTTSAEVVDASPVDLVPANNKVSLVTTVNNPTLILVPAGSTLLSESILPPTGGMDPGELVSVNLALRNVGISNTVALKATLTNTGGVTGPSGEQTYGVVVAGGDPVARPFTFTATGTNGGTLTATLQIADGTNNLGTVSFNFILGASARFVNASRISIPDNGAAIPYPSQISISNLAGVVGKVTVTLSNISHAYPDDIDALLVSPSGRGVVLMSDAGGNRSLNNVTLTFDDAAASSLPDLGPITSGTWKPTNYDNLDTFPLPAPAGPYSTLLSSFNGGAPNGLWSLFVLDDSFGDLGSIDGGWSLNITTVGRLTLAPARLRLAGTTNGLFRFTVDGVPGDSFLFEASTDLQNWTPIGTNSLTSSSLIFLDATSTNYNWRFYRAFQRP